MSLTTSTVSGVHGRLAALGARRYAVVLAVAGLVAGLLAIPVSQHLPTANAATATTQLPFDLPATASLQSTTKKVFAHYWPPMPLSIDNKAPDADYYAKNYMVPNGENNKHAAYGGYLRDRPTTHQPSTASDWRVQDLRTEVQQAIDGGLDGFAVDILQMPGDGDTLVANAVPNLLTAAAQQNSGFKIMLMPDMSGSMANKTVAQWGAYLNQLAASPAAYRLSDGRLVVSPFAAEVWTVAKWTELINLMKNTYGITVAFMPTFVANEQNYSAAFAPISFGMSNWGSRNPAWTDPTLTFKTGPTGRGLQIKALGKQWMQPVALQDERPNQGTFDEAGNTQTLRNSWALARQTNADFVQLTTWNDYSEGSMFAPTAARGPAFLDLNAYYLDWYKTGTAPTIVRDTVYLTHRKQLAAAKPSYPQTKLMTLRGGTAARDTVEALTFLTAPATVNVTVGGVTTACQAPAGVSTCTVALRAGSVSSAVVRSGSTVASVTSPATVTATPYVQDLQYVAASSGRQGGSTTPPVTPTPTPTTPTPTPTPTPTTPTPTPTTPGGASTVAITPSADTYANQGAPSTNYSTTSSLASRGNLGATSYLTLPVPAPPAGKTLTGAVLRVRTTTDPSAGSGDEQKVLMTVASDLPTVNWTNQILSPNAWLLGTQSGMTTPNTSYDIPLDADTVAYIIGGGKTLNLALDSDGTDALWVWSGDYPVAASRPTLVLTYQ